VQPGKQVIVLVTSMMLVRSRESELFPAKVRASAFSSLRNLLMISQVLL
jgi:hypothetical protein